MENFGLPERTIKDLYNYFFKKNDIEKVIIFGSRAKGTYRNGSDIDFAILTKNNKTFYKIAGELDDLPTPYKFDIINYSKLEDCAIKESIDKYGKIFYIRKNDFSI